MRRLIKIKYVWYEGEEGSSYLLTSNNIEEEKEIDSILKRFIEETTLTMNELGKLPYDDERKKWFVNCLPSAYEKLIEKCELNGFEEIEVDFRSDDYNFNPTYFVEDECSENHEMKYYLTKRTTTYQDEELKDLLE